MRLIIISLILMAVTAIVGTVASNSYHKYEKGSKKRERRFQVHQTSGIIFIISAAAFVIISYIALIGFINRSSDVRAINEDYYFLTTIYESETFEESSSLEKMMIYEEIVEYNDHIMTIKKRSKNPWTNFIFPDRFWSKQDLKLIELE